MNVIFIPTDFQVEFLQIIPALTKAIGNSCTDVILGHLFKAKNYEQFYWKKNIKFKKIDPDFVKDCEAGFALKKDIKIRNFAGSSLAGLKLFFEANHVDMVLNPVDYHFKKISKYSIQNPSKVIKRSGFPVHDIYTALLSYE